MICKENDVVSIFNLLFIHAVPPRQIQVCLTIYIDAKIDPKVSYYDYIIAYLYPFVSFQRREFTISQHFQIANIGQRVIYKGHPKLC